MTTSPRYWISRFRELDPRQAFLVFQVGLGFIAISTLGTYRLFQGNVLHALFDYALVGLFVVITRYAIKPAYIDVATRLLVGVYTLGVWLVLILMGDKGLYWSFAGLLASFFAIPVRDALINAGITLIICITVVFSEMAADERIAFFVVYLLLTGYSYYFSSRLWQENTRLEKAAHFDPITDLPNRRSLDDALSALIKELPDNTTAHTMLVIDIDHFKRINDKFGHAEGDRILGWVATVLRANLPSGAALYRFGGEEFVALLPNSESVAQRVADSMRIALEQTTLLKKDRSKVTVSIGLAGWRDIDDPRSWFQRADKALYEAKEQGRNQVRVAI